MTNQRPVDEAMAANRPEKNYIRQLWVEEVQKAERQGYDKTFPLLLTLPGGLGGEINLLIEQGVIRTTETGAIYEEDSHKIVAIESSKRAQIELLRRYPGLNILQESLQSLMRGTSQRNFPDNKEEINFCNAKIVNLDLNESIRVEEGENEITIRVIEWIKKFCLLHKEARMDWCLCLTLNGTLFWNSDINTLVINFLVDNCKNDSQFREMLIAHLGENITETLFATQIDFTIIERQAMQKVAMILIPKLLVRHAVNNGWIINTIHNYSYVGSGGAPMVTWVFNLHLNAEAASQGVTEYLNGIRNIFNHIGFIDCEGTLVCAS